MADLTSPAGPPRPLEELPGFLANLGAIVTAILSGGTVLMILASSHMRCAGASRTARLQCEQRQAEVERAVAEERHE